MIELGNVPLEFQIATAPIHRSINDSASSTVTHLCSSNNHPLVDKLRIDRTRRLRNNLLRPLLTPAILRILSHVPECVNLKAIDTRLLSPRQVTQASIFLALHNAHTRGTQREYSSKPLKHIIVKRILVFKR